MKTNIIASILLLALTMGLASCSDDSETENTGSFTQAQFQGKWCALEGPVAMVLTLESSSLEGEVYLNLSTTPTKYETLSGSWVYYPTNDMLRLQVLHSRTLQSESQDYKVLQVNDKVLKMREQETGAENIFYRMLDTKTVKQGAVFNIDYPASVGYASSNSSIASVTDDGQVRANGQGVAFISVYTQDDQMVIVKVHVEGVIETLVDEVMSDIDKVLSRYGTPDAKGQMGGNQAILYRNPASYPALAALQYQYDESTREITRILTVYNSQDAYQIDADFIVANYINHGNNLYGENAEYMSNDYLISPFISDGSCYVSYNNQNYFRRVGHF